MILFKIEKKELESITTTRCLGGIYFYHSNKKPTFLQKNGQNALRQFARELCDILPAAKR